MPPVWAKSDSFVALIIHNSCLYSIYCSVFPWINVVCASIEAYCHEDRRYTGHSLPNCAILWLKPAVSESLSLSPSSPSPLSPSLPHSCTMNVVMYRSHIDRNRESSVWSLVTKWCSTVCNHRPQNMLIINPWSGRRITETEPTGDEG